MSEENRLGIGGNNPPEEMTPFTAASQRVTELVETANVWLASVKEIADENTATACQGFLDQVNAETKAVETDRRTEKKPHEDAAKAVDIKYRPLSTRLDTIKTLLLPLKTAWLQKEQARKDAEAAAARAEAERLRRLAEEAAAAAAQNTTVEAVIAADEINNSVKQAETAARRIENDKAQVRSHFGTRASGLRTYWSARITDYRKALKHYSERAEVREVIERLAAADARTLKDDLKVPGVEAYSEQRAA